MTPKEKAEELVNNFLNVKIDLTEECWTRMKIEAAKQCALIAVDEILKLRVNVLYWQEVKQEIEKL